MPHSFFFFGILPILVFAFIDAFAKNIRVSVTATVIASFAELLLVYRLSGDFDPVSLAGTALFIIFGLYTLRTENRIWIKLQPAVVSLLVAILFGYLQFFGTPIIDRYWGLIVQVVPPDQAEMLQQLSVRDVVNLAFNWFIVVLLLYAGWIAYSATRQSQRAWVLVNVFGLFVLMFFVGIIALVQIAVS